MQQGGSGSQQVLQAVTTLQNQVPVTRYVSVITGKDTIKTVSGSVIKPLQALQNRHGVSADSSRTIISNPISLNIKRLRENTTAVRTALIRSELEDEGIAVQMKEQSFAVSGYADIFKTIKAPPSQQQTQQQVHVQPTQQSHTSTTDRQVRVVDILSDIELSQQVLPASSSSQLYQGNSLQYVDSSGDHVYSNGSSANTFQYTDSGQLYTNSQQQPNNGVYFDSSTGSAHVGSQATVSSTQHNMNNLGLSGASGAGHQGISQLISSPGGSTYLIQGAANDSSIVAMPLSHSSRASPATVQWLIEHFESAEGVSLPRALMYNHYLLHCQEQNLDPVNAASYGKLVRSVFVGLRTRRLGTRGNSKYHYYGIRIKANSPLNRLHDDLNYIAMRQQPSNHSKRFKTMNASSGVKSSGDSSSGSDLQASVTEQVQQQAQQHQQYLGDATQALPDLDPIQVTSDDDPMPDGVSQEDMMALEDLYRDHCATVLDIIVSLQFSVVEIIWKTFWRAQIESEDLQNSQLEFEQKLPRRKLILLCQWAPVQRWIKDSDHLMYQSLVEVLIPDVLRPIPSALTLAIRNFAKGLENSLSNVLNKCDLDSELVKIKLTAVSAFSQTLRRYTSLNHLAQAARAVMNDSSLTNQMLVDLNRVDFANVQEQASWVCRCEDTDVRELESAFKAALSEQRTLEHWADWLEAVVTKVLKPHENTDHFTSAARQFLLKWCFYSSMVIRDLTLRSAVSFGSFHLIRLLYDEYMFYLVEHRVAQATGETAIAVMSEFSSRKALHAPVDASPASTSSDTSSAITRSPAAFVASALISNSSSQSTKTTLSDRGVKRSASDMEARVLSVVQVNGKFPSVTGNANKNETSSNNAVAAESRAKVISSDTSNAVLSSEKVDKQPAATFAAASSFLHK